MPQGTAQPSASRERLTGMTQWARLFLVLLAMPVLNAQTSGTLHPLVVGYFPQWGLYDTPRYTPKSLLDAGGAEVLDQIDYAQGFATDGHCSVADPNADLNYTFTAAESVDGVADAPGQVFRGNLNQLRKLKQRYPKLKLIISLEGRANSFADDASPEKRESFVRSCIETFLKGELAPGIHAPGLFDGIDLDWEYPHTEDSANLLALLAEFRRQMNAVRPGLLLDIAVGPSPRMVGKDDASDIPAVAALVDHIGLMTYDYHGPWNPTTGFAAPFASADGAGGTVKNTVEAYKRAGAPAAKLLVGLPFYGYGWRQVLEENNGLNQEGVAIRGDRAYREIEPLIAQSTIFRDEVSQSPWLFDGDIFWTYDDPTSIQTKAGYVATQGLAGVMIWELGEDTGDGTLLKAARRGIITPTPSSASATSQPSPSPQSPPVRHPPAGL